MDKNMYRLTEEVAQMDDRIALMGVDIHRSSRSFTSPMYYMRNMNR